MTETFAARPLTADDLTAARRADEVTLHLHKAASIVRLYTRGRGEPVIYSAAQQRLFADDTNFRDRRARDLAVSASAYGHGDDGGTGSWRWDAHGWSGGDQVDPPSCFYSAYARDEWATIAASLRVGDTLHLEWVADNNNGYSRDAGLHVDQVRLTAMPAKRTATTQPRVWLIGWSVCQDNSARMVRRYG